MTNKEAFHSIDKKGDGNGAISLKELKDGLLFFGMPYGFIGRVLAVFDKDGN
jgi:hypothetical protein